jgi:thioredoxin reductase (NADPH)
MDPDLSSVAFPTLDAEQIAALGRCTDATLRRYPAGTTLFRAGEREFKFFVVKSGEVDILDESADTPRTVRVHRPGEFTGDVSQLTGSPALLTAVARTDCEVYEVSPVALRQVLNQCPTLSDVILQAFIARRQLLRESGNFTGLRVIGSRYSRDTFRIRDFLAKNRVPFTWLDLETEPAVAEMLQRFGISPAETPVVAYGRKLLLRNPSNRELAEAIGLRRPVEQTIYDLVIVGAGPAGLAASVYAASEGLSTIVLERTGPGGQAASSMRIENYLGFPTGITGAELADRAVIQAHKFGAKLPVPTPVASLRFDNRYAVLGIDSGETFVAKCLLIASGADYQRLTAEGCEQFEGCGVYYAATQNELQLCRGTHVAVVGAGNSAGQAAVFLSANTRKVYMLVRGDSLHKSMSSYLVQRIEQTENIEVLYRTTVRRMLGNGCLTAVEIIEKNTGEVRTLSVSALFSFIGAAPRTDWLPAEIEKDARGFVKTGPALERPASGRDPFLLETNRRGIFAAGDVRCGSIKRVASAVGEGAMVVQFVHQVLKES